MNKEEREWRGKYYRQLRKRGVDDKLALATSGQAEYLPTEDPKACANDELSYWGESDD